MSGLKVSKYDLRAARAAAIRQEAERRRAESAAKVKKAQEEQEKRRLELERKAQEKLRREMERKTKENEEIRSSISMALEAERLRQKAEIDKHSVVERVERKKLMEEGDVAKALDFHDLIKEIQEEIAMPEVSQEEIDEVLKDLVETPVEARSLLDAYDIERMEETPEIMVMQKSEEEVRFEELLRKMEEGYQEILTDRAFFKQQKERILRLEEVCKCQKEYRSYKILRDVYYGEFKAIRDARTAWHREYDKWKEEFMETYSLYRATCQMLEAAPKHYILNTTTAEADIAEMKAETERLEDEYVEKQKSLEITKILNEVMDEMGYDVLGSKTVTTRSGRKVHNTVFSYGEGSGIHVIDNNGRITMEIVGIEDEKRELSDEEKDYLVEEQEAFCDSFEELEEELAKRGVVLKDRIGKFAADRKYSDIMSMEGYTVTEKRAKTKKLSAKDKKTKRSTQQKKYMPQE